MSDLLNRVISGAGPRLVGASGKQRLSILIYHRVLPCPDYMRPGVPTTSEFNWHMELVSKYFQPLSLADALGKMAAGELPDKAICVTFDDGYADNCEVALPILKKWKIPATVFVSTAFINGGRMWNDTVIEAVRGAKNRFLDMSSVGLGELPLGSEYDRKNAAHVILEKIKHLEPSSRQDAVDLVSEQSVGLNDGLMLTTKQLLLLHNSGIEIGAHTHTHPILSTLCDEQAESEISLSREILERLIDAPVKYFAYPNGKYGSDYGWEHRELVRRLGFSASFSTHPGVSDSTSDLWQLRRFTPWDKSPNRFLIRLLRNLRNCN